MAIKTENLAIVLTDMVGFTEATVHQSRVEIEQLLDAHNRVLLPIVRRFKGRHIKSIGDALLLVFRSPTDAMLCAMAMQDALYEYNRNTPKEKQIRIRVAASLGEVRVTRKDIFGEPVNITSRICGVTPADEIYLSEALYMAMNKAEVPSQEVGWKELKGISQPVRVYHIPRFAVPRLVADVIAADDMTDLVYPFGGAHLTEHGRESRVLSGVRQFGHGVGATLKKKPVRIALASLLLVPVALLAVYLVRQLPKRPLAAPEVTRAPVAVSALREATTEPVPPKPMAPPPAPAPAPVKAAPVAPQPPAPVARPAPAPVPPPAAPLAQPPKLEYARISDAKAAFRDKRISKEELRRIISRIENAKAREIDQAKRDYRAKRLTKEEFRARVEEIEKRYE
jgi:class 3 adenylate cyclase